MKDLWVLSSLLVVLAWILSNQRSADGPPLHSHEGVYYYNPKRIVTPSTLKGIQDVVLKAKHNGHMVRPLGSGHSWNDFGQSEGIYLSLFKYRGLVKLDKLTRTVSFKGGTRLWEINSILAQHDMGLSILPSISNQTLAGALATGTHGHGKTFGNLMSYVTEVQLVTGTAEVLNVSPKSDPNIFPAVGVSVGLLGIITEATLKVEPIFNLRETSETFPLSHCFEHLNTIFNSNEHAKLWIEIASGTCVVFGANRTRQPADRVPVISQPMTDIQMYAYEALQWFLSIFPCTIDSVFKVLFSTNVFPKYQRTCISWEVFNIPHYVASNHREAEVAVPLNKCVNAIEDFIRAKKDLNLHLNHMIEVRSVKKDSFWLSNSYDMDSCHVTILLYNPSDHSWDVLTNTLFNITHSYGGRPHWGKSFTMTQDQLRDLYPKFDDFMQIRKQLDPDGIFLNDPLKETFGIE